MAKKQESAAKSVLERVYTVPLRREFLKAPNWKRTPKAVKALRQFISRHMKSENVAIGKFANHYLWRDGIKRPPHHIKVSAVKDDKGKVTVELAELPGRAKRDLKRQEALAKKKEEKEKRKEEEAKKQAEAQKGEQPKEEKKTEGTEGKAGLTGKPGIEKKVEEKAEKAKDGQQKAKAEKEEVKELEEEQKKHHGKKEQPKEARPKEQQPHPNAPKNK